MTSGIEQWVRSYMQSHECMVLNGDGLALEVMKKLVDEGGYTLVEIVDDTGKTVRAVLRKKV